MANDLSSELEQILKRGPIFQMVFNQAAEINLPNWYVAGGCVTQTIWNDRANLSPIHGLKDVDLVYFKSQSEQEDAAERSRIEMLFSTLPISVDVINEARVHEWYPSKFGYEIAPYSSSEDGITTWLPAFSVGVRIENSSSFKIFAPFGLSDAFEMIVRPNKRQITEAIYDKMVSRLRKDWPTIRVIPWS